MQRKTGELTLGTPSHSEILLQREFEAPRDAVFQALTEPNVLRRWLLGPPGWTMTICEVDLRPEGRYRYVWRHDADGATMGMGGEYREVTQPEHIVATECFDEPWYPGEAISMLELREENGRTIVANMLRYESQAARDVVLQSGMDHGVAASYDRLEKLLKEGKIFYSSLRRH